MMFQYFTSQEITIQMSINFSRSDFFVSEHLLDRPQICASFQQVCGKRMAEGMRTDCFPNAS